MSRLVSADACPEDGVAKLFRNGTKRFVGFTTVSKDDVYYPEDEDVENDDRTEAARAVNVTGGGSETTMGKYCGTLESRSRPSDDAGDTADTSGQRQKKLRASDAVQYGDDRLVGAPVGDERDATSNIAPGRNPSPRKLHEWFESEHLFHILPERVHHFLGADAEESDRIHWAALLRLMCRASWMRSRSTPK